MTRAELLRHALSQALRRVHIGAKKLKLDEETRWQIAGEAVEELRRYGGWKELDEEAPKTAGTRMISSESWEVKPD